MHILILVPYPAIHGPLPKHTPHLVSTLRILGCSVITESWGRHYDNETLFNKVIGRIRDIIRIHQTLTLEHFDIMLVKTSHDWFTLIRDIILLLITFRKRPITIIQFHGSQSNIIVQDSHYFFKIFTSILLSMCQAILLLSSEEYDQFKKKYPKKNFYIVDNPYKPKFKRYDFSDRFRFSSKKPVLFYVGRLIEAKGILILLEAISIVLKQFDCHLIVAGSGKDNNKVKKWIQKYDLTNNVSLLGYIDGESLIDLYQSAHIFILPSWWKEGFPTVLAEAMDAGLPIITTPIRGAVDHLSEGRNVLFIPPKKPDLLAQAIIKLLSNNELMVRMSRANREKVKEFSPMVVARKYLYVFESILNNS